MKSIITILFTIISSASFASSYGQANSIGSTAYRDQLSYFIQSDLNSDYLIYSPVIRSAHVVVKDIALDGLCGNYDMCFRALVYINGDEFTGQHVATYMTSPGNPSLDSRATFTPEGVYRVQKNQEIVLGGQSFGRVGNLHVYDHYINRENEPMRWPVFYHRGFAFHSSNIVTGELASHGCTRLRPDEAKKINFLARHVGENFTVSITDTQNRMRLTPGEIQRAILNQAEINLERAASMTDEERARENVLNGSGGLY